MDKERFLASVAQLLGALPPEDIARSLDYYREMIDDRMEDGMTEYEAVAAMGTAEEAAAQILAGAFAVPAPVAERPVKPSHRGMSWWVVLLLILGSPVWLPLGLAAVIVVISLVFALVVTVLSVTVGGVGAIVSGVISVFTTGLVRAMFLVGGGLVCVGLAMVLEPVASKVVSGAVLLWKKISRWIGGVVSK